MTVTITSCRRLALFERTVNSFLNCCTDLERVTRWVCVDNGSTESDRARMKELYPFFEFVLTDPARGERHPESMNRILGLIETPWWLHLEDDWHFFWRGPYIGRALDVMEEDGRIAQVAFNVSYGETLECRRIDAGEGRRTQGKGTPYRLHEHIDPETDEWERYLGALPAGSLSVAYWQHFTLRPSLIRAEAIASLRPFETSWALRARGGAPLRRRRAPDRLLRPDHLPAPRSPDLRGRKLGEPQRLRARRRRVPSGAADPARPKRAPRP